MKRIIFLAVVIFSLAACEAEPMSDNPPSDEPPPCSTNRADVVCPSGFWVSEGPSRCEFGCQQLLDGGQD
jgi:hypothetical protein